MTSCSCMWIKRSWRQRTIARSRVGSMGWRRIGRRRGGRRSRCCSREVTPYSAPVVLGLECPGSRGEGQMMQRSCFEHDGLTLSYLDTGGDRPLIIALHAMWMEARSFEDFAMAMPQWRVVSMDQRGHGLSDHSSDYSRAAFIGDIAGLLDHLGAREPVVII